MVTEYVKYAECLRYFFSVRLGNQLQFAELEGSVALASGILKLKTEKCRVAQKLVPHM